MQQQCQENKITLIKQFTSGKVDYFSFEVYVKGKLHYRSSGKDHYSKEFAINKAKEIISNIELEN